MKNPIAFVCFFFLAPSAVAESQEFRIVVPNSLEFEEGNINYPQSAQDVIFQNGARGQIVYPSEEFAMVPDSHRYIKGFRYRPDASVSQPREAVIENAQITLSVTSKEPSDLSLSFEENYGAKRTVVYDGPLTWSTAATGFPREFDYITDFQQPFFYDPEEGNLLIDIMETGTNISFTVTDDHSDIYGLSFVASQAGPEALASDDFFQAPVTQFVFTVPEPTTTTMLIAGLAAIGLLTSRGRRLI